MARPWRRATEPRRILRAGQCARQRRSIPPLALKTQTPFILLALAAPFAARIRRPAGSRRGPHVGTCAQACSASGSPRWCWRATWPYSPFEEWWYLRFLLPAIPVLLVLRRGRPAVGLASGGAGRRARVPLVVAGVGLLAWHCVATAGERSALRSAASRAAMSRPARSPHESLPQTRRPAERAGKRSAADVRRPDDAAVRLPRPEGLDAAVEFLDREGIRPYFVLEAWEEAQFRERFAGSSPLGLLDWPPHAEVGRPGASEVLRPRDRQRFLAGEPVTTARSEPQARPRPARAVLGSLLSAATNCSSDSA